MRLDDGAVSFVRLGLQMLLPVPINSKTCTTQLTSFIKGFVKLAGLPFQPNITSPNASLPRVIVIHSRGRVMERAASLYLTDSLRKSSPQ